MTRLTRHLSYANVAATLALVLAIGAGTAYAASRINGNTIVDKTISGAKLKPNTLTGKQIKEGKLKQVPKAKDAKSLGGVKAGGYVKGSGAVQVGRTTGPGSAAVPVVPLKTFVTPVGQFELSCGAANVDIRYRNSTAGTVDLWRTVIVAGTGGGIDGDAEVDFFDQPPASERGYSTTAAQGPSWVELSAGSAAGTATLTATGVRVGQTCRFNWTFTTTP
jgi:hypothetical protein